MKKNPVNADKINAFKNQIEKKAKVETTQKTTSSNQRYVRLSTNDFIPKFVIGVGAFGVVRGVTPSPEIKHLFPPPKEEEGIVALKQMPKHCMQKKNQRDRVFAERTLLSEMDTPWVVRLYLTFQDAEYLYMAMEYLEGGDLMSHFMRLDIFDEPTARFYAAELFLAIHSVHKMGYIHRDIKPDNIVLTKYGHIKLLDFGLCKFSQNFTDMFDIGHDAIPNEHQQEQQQQSHLVRLNRNQLKSAVGTPQYMAPEVFRRDYTIAADWWSAGIIVYESLMGGVPFSHPRNDPEKIMHQVSNWKRYLLIPFPGKKMSKNAEHLLKGILSEPYENRFGFEQIKDHPFFNGLKLDESLCALKAPIDPIRDVVKRKEKKEDKSNMKLPEYVPQGRDRDTNLEYAGYTFLRQ